MTVERKRLITIEESEFFVRFTLKTNHLDRTASFGGADGGCLFSASSKEFAFVLRQNPRAIWTVVDGDHGETLITSGLHLVNRIGYLVSEQLREPDTDYTVLLD